MNILCLDLEGVLIPEIWVGVAEATGLGDLKLTTKDIPVYRELMKTRLRIIEEHNIGMNLIQDVIAHMSPFPGASAFLNWARNYFQVAIISDTFYEFAQPLMSELGWPMLLCHKLDVTNNRITGYRLRQEDPKRHSIKAFQGLNYKVFAAGDSFNDIPMLEEADQGFFFAASDSIQKQYPYFKNANNYSELQKLLLKALERVVDLPSPP